MTLLNRREISARRGQIVSGQQTTGETTALKLLGRTHQLMVRQRYPGRLADRIPGLYVTTPPKLPFLSQSERGEPDHLLQFDRRTVAANGSLSDGQREGLDLAGQRAG